MASKEDGATEEQANALGAGKEARRNFPRSIRAQAMQMISKLKYSMSMRAGTAFLLRSNIRRAGAPPWLLQGEARKGASRKHICSFCAL